MRHWLGILRMVLGSLLLLMLAAAAGLAVNVAATRAIFEQGVSYGDLRAVAFWSFMALLISFPFVYFPLISWLRARPRGVMATVAAFLAAGLVPLALMGGLFGARSVWTPEAMLLAIDFGAASVALGLAHRYLAHRAGRRSPGRAI